MDRRLLVAVFVVALAGALVVPPAVATEAGGSDGAGHAAGGTDTTATVDVVRLAASSEGLRRADTDGVLDQPTRAAVYGAIRERPGRSLSRIAAAVGVAKSTAEYHVDVLQQAGLVAVTTLGDTRRYAPADADADLAAVLAAPSTAAILEAVAAHEPASVTTVADATDRAASTASHHLARLEDRGLLDRERVGESVLATLAPPARRALADDPTPAEE